MTPRAPLVSVSTSRKLTLLGSLYFAQGLPFGFFTQALPVLMRKSGFSLGEVGLSSLLAVPWALKFLWAPAVDRHWTPRLGRRRSWILPLQLFAIVLLAALGISGRASSMHALMLATLLLNLVAATQDIATDGLAVDMLSSDERGLANGLQVAGYRLGMIVGGGALLIFYDRLGAPFTFGAMAALTAFSTLPIGFHREQWRPPSTQAGPSSPAPHFLRRPEAARVLLVVMTYKAGEAFATGMLRPFLADVGLGLADIGWLIGTVGFISGLVGALVGGALVGRLGRRPALLTFGLIQAVAVGSYAYVAFAMPGRAVLFAICGLEHFSGGMATAALFTCMMDWCSSDTSATDYTVQASAVVVATGLASAVAGISAQHLGYWRHFSLATLLAFCALAVVQTSFPNDVQASGLTPARRRLPKCA
jgi:RhtX/FptX family siderophore transporter